MLQPREFVLSQQEFGASTQGCVRKTLSFSSVAATCPAGSTGRADTSGICLQNAVSNRLFSLPPWNKTGMCPLPSCSNHSLSLSSRSSVMRDENHQV